MKQSGRCPKCSCTDLYHADYIHAGSPGWWLALDPAFRKRKGFFEAYVCRNCGFTEIYVKHVQDIPSENTKGRA